MSTDVRILRELQAADQRKQRTHVLLWSSMAFVLGFGCGMQFQVVLWRLSAFWGQF